MRPVKIPAMSVLQGRPKLALVPSTVTVPESPALSPRVTEAALAPELLICAVPPLLIRASVEELGTPLFQFAALNQLPVVPVQVVVVVARAGELQTAKARTMNRQIRADCDADLFFISCLRRGPRRRGDRLIDFRKLRIVIFFVPFLVEAGSFEETMSCHAADLAWPDRRSARETVAEQLLVIHSADSLRRKAAEQEGVEMLHAVCWKSAMEGNLEPVYWQGKIVGEVRKYDNRLRIEMLRAYMPDKFKTPGAKVSINSGNSLNVGIVMSAKEIAEIQAMRQGALREMAAEKAGQIAGFW
jgi:hypothetical protein